MKRFLLFAGKCYEQRGGAFDLIGSFDSLGEAAAALSGRTTDEWAHALDVTTGGIVAAWAQDTTTIGVVPTWEPSDTGYLW